MEDLISWGAKSGVKGSLKEQVFLLWLTKSGGALGPAELRPDSNPNGCLLERENRIEQILSGKFFLLT